MEYTQKLLIPEIFWLSQLLKDGWRSVILTLEFGVTIVKVYLLQSIESRISVLINGF